MQKWSEEVLCSMDPSFIAKAPPKPKTPKSLSDIMDHLDHIAADGAADYFDGVEHMDLEAALEEVLESEYPDHPAGADGADGPPGGADADGPPGGADADVHVAPVALVAVEPIDMLPSPHVCGPGVADVSLGPSHPLWSAYDDALRRFTDGLDCLHGAAQRFVVAGGVRHVGPAPGWPCDDSGTRALRLYRNVSLLLVDGEPQFVSWNSQYNERPHDAQRVGLDRFQRIFSVWRRASHLLPWLAI